MERKPIRFRPPGANYDLRIHGVVRKPVRDFYYAALGQPWSVTLLMIASAFLAANALFALGYWVTGGIANASPHSFTEAFFFSVQTMGTIGYGAMYPASRAANWLVVAESIVGLTLTALATGLVFAKFSRPTARIIFSREATISPMNSVPTLMFRIGNERSNPIVDAKIRVCLVRTEATHEGKTFYRTYDLKLVRGNALSLSRSWSVMHVLDDASPLRNSTPESLMRDEVELQVLVLGLDDTSMQPVHAAHIYAANQIVWGARLVDVVTDVEGTIEINLNLFHDLESTPPTSDFPYSLERATAVRVAPSEGGDTP